MTTSKKKNGTDGAAKVEAFTRDLRVKLSDREVAERADRAAELIANRDAREEDLKAYAKTEKSKIATMESELRELSREVRSHSTFRPVTCERTFDYRTGGVTERRLDTGDVLDERPMTDYERQLGLNMGEGGADADKPELATEKKRRAPRGKGSKTEARV